MKISTRGEYGLRALMELGTEPGQAMSLRDIAGRQHISLDYLEQIVPALKNAGLVRSKRGAQGGYLLAREPGDITIFDALVALEGPFDPMSCLSTGPSTVPGCGASNSCAVQEVWRELQEAIEKVLKNLTLAEMLNRQERLYGVPIRTYRERELTRLVVL